VASLFANVIFRPTGRHLALHRSRSRDSAASTSNGFPYGAFLHSLWICFVGVCLSGSERYVFPLRYLKRTVLINSPSCDQMRSIWYVFACYDFYGWWNTSFLMYRLATQMFMMPSLITMSSAATRMYRSLADFASANEAYGVTCSN
jgi:hypothetical protein